MPFVENLHKYKMNGEQIISRSNKLNGFGVCKKENTKAKKNNRRKFNKNENKIKENASQGRMLELAHV